MTAWQAIDVLNVEGLSRANTAAASSSGAQVAIKEAGRSTLEAAIGTKRTTHLSPVDRYARPHGGGSESITAGQGPFSMGM
jgi:hypothetical protein